MAEPLQVLLEDPHLLIVAKPPGLLTQGTIGGEATLESWVRRHLGLGPPGSGFLGTVHRLDRPVSGVVIWGKTVKAARRLSAQFASRDASKEYWAVVEGEAPAERVDVWEDWLTDPDASKRVHAVASDVAGARHALTRVQEGRGGRLPARTSWLRLWPETGRTHQLRAQSSRRGRPILGDHAYGSSHPFPGGIALHARRLCLNHPILRQSIDVIAPLPADWSRNGIDLPEAPPSGA